MSFSTVRIGSTLEKNVIFCVANRLRVSRTLARQSIAGQRSPHMRCGVNSLHMLQDINTAAYGVDSARKRRQEFSSRLFFRAQSATSAQGWRRWTEKVRERTKDSCRLGAGTRGISPWRRYASLPRCFLVAWSCRRVLIAIAHPLRRTRLRPAKAATHSTRVS